MLKYVPLNKINRIQIYINKSKRTLAAIKKETGADYLINGGVYSGSKAVMHLKSDGYVYAEDPYTYFGYAWDTGPDMAMGIVPADKENYINCVELIRHGTPNAKPRYNPDMGGRRGRTAMGIMGDKLCLYVSGDGTSDAKTPEGLRDELAALGWDSALMLDGGGSSQCDFGGGQSIYSSRRVNNYICVWLRKNSQNDKDKEDKPVSNKVCLDPGHGVETAGKRSPDGTYLEHEFNLNMAGRLKALLERHGVEVTLTRATQNDVTLQKRVQIANGIKDLDLFVSLHSNASGDGKDWTAPDGYGIYTSAAGVTAGRNIAAGKLIARVKEAGIKLWGNGLFHNISLYVLKNTTAPAVLIEHGFHTNKAETELLKTDAYRQRLAELDCKGILDYLGVAWQDETATEGNSTGAADWAAAAWAKAKNKGIMDGTRPTEPVSRQELAVVLDRLNLI